MESKLRLTTTVTTIGRMNAPASPPVGLSRHHKAPPGANPGAPKTVGTPTVAKGKSARYLENFTFSLKLPYTIKKWKSRRPLVVQSLHSRTPGLAHSSY